MEKLTWILELKDKISGNLRELNKKVASLGDSFSHTRSKIQTVPGSIESVRQKLERLEEGRNKAFRVDHIRRYNQMIASTRTELSRLENLPLKSFMARLHELPAAFGMIGKGLIVATIANKLRQLGGSIFNATAQVEQYTVTLENMLGSKIAANLRMQEYTEIAKKTPFELSEVVETGNQLQALGRYSEDNIVLLGDLAAASGKPIEQAKNAFAKLATGQKGEAVNMFRDLLISTDDWVKATGKGVSKNGELLATTEEMLAVLPQILQEKGFAGMMDKQAQTFAGRMSNIRDSLFQMFVSLGNAFRPIIDAIITGLGRIVEGLKSMADWMVRNKEVLTALAVGVGVATAAWAAYRTMLFLTSAASYKAVIPAIKAIGKAIYNIPIIGWLAAIIGALIAVGTYFYKTSATFRGFLWGLWEGIKAVFTGLAELAREVFGSIALMIKGLWNFDYVMIAEGVQKLKEGFAAYGEGIGNAFKKGREKGMADFYAEQEEKLAEQYGMSVEQLRAEKAEAEKAGKELNQYLEEKYGTAGKLTPIVVDPVEPEGDEPDLTSDLNTIGGGGKSIKQINITLDSLIHENNNIINNEVTDAEGFRDRLKALLLTLLNDVNQIAAN